MVLPDRLEHSKLTHPILSHPKWTRVHSEKEHPLLAVAIAMDIALVCLSSVVQGVVDMSDRWREVETVQFLTHVVFY